MRIGAWTAAIVAGAGLASAASASPHPGSGPLIKPTDRVRFSTKDVGAEAFLGTIMPCPMIPATMFDFLDMRAQDVASIGMKQRWAIVSKTDGRVTRVTVTENVTRPDGSAYPGVLPMVMYAYVVQFPVPHYVGKIPDYAPTEDPVAFFTAHWEAVCNNMELRHRAPQPF